MLMAIIIGLILHRLFPVGELQPRINWSARGLSGVYVIGKI